MAGSAIHDGMTINIGGGFSIYGSPSNHQNVRIWFDNLFEFERQKKTPQFPPPFRQAILALLAGSKKD